MQKEEEVPGRGVKRAREQGDKQGILSGPIGQERKERIPCHERDAVCGSSILTGRPCLHGGRCGLWYWGRTTILYCAGMRYAEKCPEKGLRSDVWGSKQRVTDPAVDLSRDCFVAALPAMTCLDDSGVVRRR